MIWTWNLVPTVKASLKTGFCFFEKIHVTTGSIEKLPFHVDFPYISSIALFKIYSVSHKRAQSSRFPTKNSLADNIKYILDSRFLVYNWEFNCVGVFLTPLSLSPFLVNCLETFFPSYKYNWIVKHLSNRAVFYLLGGIILKGAKQINK